LQRGDAVKAARGPTVTSCEAGGASRFGGPGVNAGFAAKNAMIVTIVAPGGALSGISNATDL
jgi:hypothetical protein